MGLKKEWWSLRTAFERSFITLTTLGLSTLTLTLTLSLYLSRAKAPTFTEPAVTEQYKMANGEGIDKGRNGVG